MYVQSLFWVQLWPPLYAILNMVMMMHSQDLASMTAGQGLAMADYSILNNAYISDQAIAGMIAATAIPAIASAIVKGGDVGAQAIAGMVSPSREADKVASSIASGNISMGNGSLDNTSSNNNNQFQDMARPNTTQGGWSNSGSDGIKHSYYGGHESVDDSARAQNTAMKMDVSGRLEILLQPLPLMQKKRLSLNPPRQETASSPRIRRSNLLSKGTGKTGTPNMPIRHRLRRKPSAALRQKKAWRMKPRRAASSAQTRRRK